MKQYEVTVRECWNRSFWLWAQDEADAREQAELLLANQSLVSHGGDFGGVDIIVTEALEISEQIGG